MTSTLIQDKDGDKLLFEAENNGESSNDKEPQLSSKGPENYKVIIEGNTNEVNDAIGNEEEDEQEFDSEIVRVTCCSEDEKQIIYIVKEDGNYIKVTLRLGVEELIEATNIGNEHEILQEVNHVMKQICQQAKAAGFNDTM